MTRARLPALSLAVQYPSRAGPVPNRSQVRRWVRAACTLPATVTVRFIDAAEGRRLNADYRGKDYPTNVLSFAYRCDEQVAGDLAICIPVVEAEASQQNKLLDMHYAHLIVHGMLHLQGYDHETGPVEATRMEQCERAILASLGIPDPYC